MHDHIIKREIYGRRWAERQVNPCPLPGACGGQGPLL